MAGTNPNEARPTGEARVTMYDVGFGDCYLLTVPYSDGTQRNVLFDCGAHSIRKEEMLKVSEAVKEDCGGKLHVIVATHRHKDHISGFGMDGPAAVFKGLAPELVVQPWTEDPQADAHFEGPPGDGLLGVAQHLTSLDVAQEYAEALVRRLAAPGPGLKGVSDEVKRDLETIAGLNITNKKAVAWLASAGKDREFVHAGSDAEKLKGLLPGVGVRVLGPPTLVQDKGIRREATTGGDEFWKLQKALLDGRPVGGGEEEALFPGAATRDPALAGPQDRWMMDRLNRVQTDNVQWIVRSLDDALNNTSIILLLEVGRHRLLFAGDAQVENWGYALKQPELIAGLQEAALYKVGHHASGNATPRSLWEILTEGKRGDGARRLVTMLSTEEDTYKGVPQVKLMAALEDKSELHCSIEMVKEGKLRETVVLEA